MIAPMPTTSSPGPGGSAPDSTQPRQKNMKASAAFVHQNYPRVALKVADNDFFVIETARHTDVGIADHITGDLAMTTTKWCFNVTRGSLVPVKVLGRFATLPLAIRAMSKRIKA
jgi:hypothetical protein